MTPANVAKLLTSMEKFEAMGKKLDVDWIDAALAAYYRGSKRQFMNLIYSNDDNSHETVKLVLRKWADLMKDKQGTVEDARGVTPKATTPPRTEKVVPKAEHEVVGLTEAECRLMLERHNVHRATYGAAPLAYDARLASKAQAWALHLINQMADGPLTSVHNPVRTVDGLEGNTGENIGRMNGSGYEPGKFDPPHAHQVDAWVAEVKDYDLAGKKPKGTGQTGHFTQVVWKGTTRVGCGFAMAFLPGKRLIAVWVCNYHPGGNVDGHHAKNV